ncbi:hypothetical protein GCM10022223_08260 [Kineosporia mesophila]|uniref:Uncharacterized protein n=1 Tax=Kineosporia mesophila TaxID=566012 RepID=A0ABP6Z4P2_9ACTN|nr:hypothetical protein [Kineosporia mesophila]MCD5351204.1 hypothetical protein [Kineosporia mesophila]
MSQRPANSPGNDQPSEPAESAPSGQSAQPAPTAQPVRSLVLPVRPGQIPPSVLRADGPPPEVLRQWSDALSAAGLYSEALAVHPALERVDVVRLAELAVLAGIHTQAQELLRELNEGESERSRRNVTVLGPTGQDRAAPPSPWLDLLGRVAELLAGTGDLAAVNAAAAQVQPSAAMDWIVALAAVSVGDLPAAAVLARAARAGGCRDLRMLTIAAADEARQGQYSQALDLTAQAQRIALPDEDPAALTVHVLQRCGFADAARGLALAGVGDSSLSPASRTDWKAAAASTGAGGLSLLRERVKAHGHRPRRRIERKAREAEAIASYDLTCRCYASGGWIGPSRHFYLQHHLHELLPAPVAGLDARLMICRATSLTFLDLVAREITLPVPSTPPSTVLTSGPDEERPTPGMGVSLGLALPA